MLGWREIGDCLEAASVLLSRLVDSPQLFQCKAEIVPGFIKLCIQSQCGFQFGDRFLMLAIEQKGSPQHGTYSISPRIQFDASFEMDDCLFLLSKTQQASSQVAVGQEEVLICCKHLPQNGSARS